MYHAAGLSSFAVESNSLPTPMYPTSLEDFLTWMSSLTTAHPQPETLGTTTVAVSLRHTNTIFLGSDQLTSDNHEIADGLDQDFVVTVDDDDDCQLQTNQYMLNGMPLYVRKRLVTTACTLLMFGVIFTVVKASCLRSSRMR